MEADGQAIIGPPTSQELNLVTLNCSVQQSSSLNAIHPPVQVTPIKHQGDLVKRYRLYPWLSMLKDACH